MFVCACGVFVSLSLVEPKNQTKNRKPPNLSKVSQEATTNMWELAFDIKPFHRILGSIDFVSLSKEIFAC